MKVDVNLGCQGQTRRDNAQKKRYKYVFLMHNIDEISVDENP